MTRPGGAALNAGQVFGTRCAEHVAARRGFRRSTDNEQALVEDSVNHILGALRGGSGLSAKTLRTDVQDRMSDHAGILCNVADVKTAVSAAHALNEAVRQQGLAFDGANEALRALQWRQSALASEAVLVALAFYLERGGGSRGARAVCSPDGAEIPQARLARLEDAQFTPERDEDRGEQIYVRFAGNEFACDARPIRRRDQYQPFFERDWPDYLTGAIHDPVVSKAANRADP